MHPFYGPSARLLGGRTGERTTTASGLLSMAAYLAFWAGALVIAKRELDARFPRARPDVGVAILRERFARGEIDEQQFRAMSAVLADSPAPPG